MPRDDRENVLELRKMFQREEKKRTQTAVHAGAIPTPPTRGINYIINNVLLNMGYILNTHLCLPYKRYRNVFIIISIISGGLLFSNLTNTILRSTASKEWGFFHFINFFSFTLLFVSIKKFLSISISSLVYSVYRVFDLLFFNFHLFAEPRPRAPPPAASPLTAAEHIAHHLDEHVQNLTRPPPPAMLPVPTYIPPSQHVEPAPLLPQLSPIKVRFFAYMRMKHVYTPVSHIVSSHCICLNAHDHSRRFVYCKLNFFVFLF